MILQRFLTVRSCFCHNFLLRDIQKRNSGNNFKRFRSYSGLVPNVYHQRDFIQANYCKDHEKRRWLSKGLLDGDVTGLLKGPYEQDQKTITEIFPTPRVTLNEFASRVKEKVFDISYKQTGVAPKGVRKKAKVSQSSEWVSTYTFVWPEKMKFESTALSKKLAAERAASQALQWLYTMRKIDKDGLPILCSEKIAELKIDINEPLKVTIGDKSMEKIAKVWSDYEAGIRDIYEQTHEEAMINLRSTTFAVIKDSTIDEDDAISDQEQHMGQLSDDFESRTLVNPVYGVQLAQPTESSLRRREVALNRTFEDSDESLMSLPIDSYSDRIVSTLRISQCLVIVGAAGCGKSTRVPRAVLRAAGVACRAVVAEPRRVAAVGLAERVASELGEQIGESVGYQVRLQAKPPRAPGAILYCTSGVLLRRLQLNPGLEGCTHVFIDEAHERDVNTDVTLLLLKRAMDVNPELRVVIMSATLDADVFTRYFNDCPVIEVPGRTFPVEVSYLEDMAIKFKSLKLANTMEASCKEEGRPNINCFEVSEVIKAVDRNESEGAILVFLPGWAEIKTVKKYLDQAFQESTHMILPVHSRLSTADQTRMFARPLPGVRKIVLATNIAETSITIPDVVYVIDSGAHRENRIREGTGTASLETVWVSLAGAKQRAGRAGRVQPGHCYRLYTRQKESEFEAHSKPEILRIPLEQTVLDCKSYAPDEKVEDFLSQLPEPPSRKAIDLAVKDLVDLGALTPTEQLTSLGHHISKLTLHPRIATALLNACALGNAVAAANVATHVQDSVEVFENANDRREEIREFKRKYSDTSDHAALHWIQQDFEQRLDESGWDAVDQWCRDRGLRRDRLNYVKSLSSLHLEQVLRSGFVGERPRLAELNRFSSVDELTIAAFLSGVNSLLRVRKRIRRRKAAIVLEVLTSTGGRAHIGSESVNHAIHKSSDAHASLLVHFGGFHSVERRALVMYKTSLVSPHVPLLFSKGTVTKEDLADGETSLITLPRHHLHIHVPTSQADLLLKTREMLWSTLQFYYERDVNDLDPDIDTLVSRFKVRLVKCAGRVLVEAARRKCDDDCQEDEFYYERDVNDLDPDIDTLVSRFKVRLVKCAGRVLVEAARGKCDDDCQEDEFYYERDVNDLDPDIDTLVSRFKVRLVKCAGRVLVEAARGKCDDDCQEDEFYYERDVNDLDPDIDTLVSRFKVRLVKCAGRVLVEAARGKCDDDCQEDEVR